jgi:hypothetical protein
MKSRSCNLSLTIANDAGKVCRYSVKPIDGGFRLVNLSEQPSPVYHVRLSPEAKVSCTCPIFVRSSTCKHADAIVAAGLLPVRLMEMLINFRRLLDSAEERVAEANRQAAAALAETERIASEAGTERQVHEYDAEAMREQSRELEMDLAEVSQRALQLQAGLAAVQSAAPRRQRRKPRMAA